MQIFFYIQMFTGLLVITSNIALCLIFSLIITVIGIILMWRQVRKKNIQILSINGKNEELKELLDEAVNSNKEFFEELTAAKQKNKNIISKTSREINTSVNSILGMANLLKDSELNNEQLRNTNAIIKSGEKLLQNTKAIFEGDNRNNILINNLTMGDESI